MIGLFWLVITTFFLQLALAYVGLTSVTVSKGPVLKTFGIVLAEPFTICKLPVC